MADKVRLDPKGIRELLTTQPELIAAVNDLAEKIGADVAGQFGVEVEVDHYTTDRGAAKVTIADPTGMELQVTQGALTRAAARVGLEVVEK